LQGTGNVPLVDLPGGQATNGAEGFVRFSGVNSFIPGAVGPGFLAAIRKAGGGQAGRFGYLLTGASGAGTVYALPQGKGFLIGSLGTGAQVYGTLGSAGGGTAVLAGGAKHAAGQTLAGFGGGDINVHANAAGDTQSLNVFARSASDSFVLGDAGAPIVFCPTYGDSGVSSAITLMAKRTGATTLNKIGAGTNEVRNVAFTHTDGTDAQAGFTYNVNAGTLFYTGTDAGSGYAAMTVASGATLCGNGHIKASAFTLASGAELEPGNGTADELEITGTTVTLSNGSIVNMDLGDPLTPSASDKVTVTGALTASGQLNIVPAAGFATGNYDIMTCTGALDASGLTIGTIPSGYSATIQTIAGSPNTLRLVIGTVTRGTQIIVR
jgi:hypothetical protein